MAAVKVPFDSIFPSLHLFFNSKKWKKSWEDRPPGFWNGWSKMTFCLWKESLFSSQRSGKAFSIMNQTSLSQQSKKEGSIFFHSRFTLQHFFRCYHDPCQLYALFADRSQSSLCLTHNPIATKVTIAGFITVRLIDSLQSVDKVQNKSALQNKQFCPHVCSFFTSKFDQVEWNWLSYGLWEFLSSHANFLNIFWPHFSACPSPIFNNGEKNLAYS